jgi:hypothetical protein
VETELDAMANDAPFAAPTDEEYRAGMVEAPRFPRSIVRLLVVAALAAGCGGRISTAETLDASANADETGQLDTSFSPPEVGLVDGAGDAPPDVTSTEADAGHDDGIDSAPPVPKVCASDAFGRPRKTSPATGYGLGAGDRSIVPNDFDVVAIGDVTGDGRADLVAADWNTVLVVPQNADGTLGGGTANTRPFANPTWMVLADLDGDGVLEIVTSQRDGLRVHRAQVDGSLKTLLDQPGPLVIGAITADVDGDGHVDIVGVGYDETGYSSDIVTFRGDGAGGFRGVDRVPYGTYRDQITSIAVADMDGDGRMDLLYATTKARLVMLPRVDANTWGAPTLSMPLVGVSTPRLDVGDLDGDGRLDLVTGDQDVFAAPKVQIFAQQVDHTFGAPLVVGSNAYGCDPVRVFDIDADGRKDIAVVHPSANEVGVLLARGAVLGAEARTAVPTAASVAPALAVGDLDCDGCPDLAVVNVRGLVVFRGKGCGAP